MKKVLMIAYYFPPVGGSGVIRTLKFAKYLPKYGWKPEILTIKDNCYESYMPRDFSLLNEIPVDLAVCRTSVIKPLDLLFAIRRRFKAVANSKKEITPSTHAENTNVKTLMQRFKDAITSFLSIPDKQIGWLPFALIKGRAIIKKNGIDIIYSTASPWTTHLIGYLLKKITKKYWVADFRDPWTLDLLYEEKGYTKLRKITEQFLEKKIMNAADKVVCISETMKNNLVNKYPFLKEKIEVITNGFDREDFAKEESIKKSSKFTISYIGTLYHNRDPKDFIIALAQVVNANKEVRENIKVKFVGMIEKEIEFKQLISDFNLKEIVKMVNYIPQKEALQYLKNSDVLLLIIGNDKRGDYILTGKIFEYLASNKPILALVPEGEAANLIRETKAGIVVDPENTEEIKKSIVNFYSKYKQGCLKIDSDINKIEKFDREKLTGNLTKIMESCLKIDF